MTYPNRVIALADRLMDDDRVFHISWNDVLGDTGWCSLDDESFIRQHPARNIHECGWNSPSRNWRYATREEILNPAPDIPTTHSSWATP